MLIIMVSNFERTIYSFLLKSINIFQKNNKQVLNFSEQYLPTL